MKKMMAAVLALVLVAVAVPAQAKQETDGGLCWTGGYVVPIGVSSWSRTQVRFRIENEWGGWVAQVQLDPMLQGPMTDFLYNAAILGQPVEIVTKATRYSGSKIVKCGSPLVRPLDAYPWDGVENVEEPGELG